VHDCNPSKAARAESRTQKINLTEFSIISSPLAIAPMGFPEEMFAMRRILRAQNCTFAQVWMTDSPPPTKSSPLEKIVSGELGPFSRIRESTGMSLEEFADWMADPVNRRRIGDLISAQNAATEALLAEHRRAAAARLLEMGLGDADSAPPETRRRACCDVLKIRVFDPYKDDKLKPRPPQPPPPAPIMHPDDVRAALEAMAVDHERKFDPGYRPDYQPPRSRARSDEHRSDEHGSDERDRGPAAVDRPTKARINESVRPVRPDEVAKEPAAVIEAAPDLPGATPPAAAQGLQHDSIETYHDLQPAGSPASRFAGSPPLPRKFSYETLHNAPPPQPANPLAAAAKELQHDSIETNLDLQPAQPPISTAALLAIPGPSRASALATASAWQPLYRGHRPTDHPRDVLLALCPELRSRFHTRREVTPRDFPSRPP
jgi:hypothetical protein